MFLHPIDLLVVPIHLIFQEVPEYLLFDAYVDRHFQSALTHSTNAVRSMIHNLEGIPEPPATKMEHKRLRELFYASCTPCTQENHGWSSNSIRDSMGLDWTPFEGAPRYSEELLGDMLLGAFVFLAEASSTITRNDVARVIAVICGQQSSALVSIKIFQ